MPAPVRDITVTGGLLDRRNFLDPTSQGLENRHDRGHSGRFVARVRDLAAPNRLGESDDEAKEVLGGVGVVEPAEIVRRLDPLDRDLELVRRRDDRDLLRLRHGRQDDRLLLRVQGFQRQVDGGGADGAVGRRRGDAGEGGRGGRVSGGAAASGAGGAGVSVAGAAGGGRRLGRSRGAAVAVRFHRKAETETGKAERGGLSIFEDGGGGKTRNL